MRGTAVQGTIVMPKCDKDSIIPETSAKQFSLILKKDISWYVGIDQSTSCTGIALVSNEGSFVVLLDVKRDKNAPKEEYFRDLRRILINLFKNQSITVIANELPVPDKSKRFSQSVLTEFLGRLNAWLDDIPELEDAQRGQLFPQVWRSYVVDKSKGPHRSTIKAEVAQDLVDNYPGLEYYYKFYHTDDYDSFDALGIILGYIRYAFTDDGYPRIHGIKEKRHVSLVLYDWIDWDESEAFEKNVQLGLGDNLQAFEPYILRYNDNYSLHDNIRMASSNYNCVATILPHDELLQFKWKYGVNTDEPNKQMMAIIMRRGEYTNGFVNSAKKAYPWNEEVFDE